LISNLFWILIDNEVNCCDKLMILIFIYTLKIDKHHRIRSRCEWENWVFVFLINIYKLSRIEIPIFNFLTYFLTLLVKNNLLMIILHINELFCGFEELNESVCRYVESKRERERDSGEKKVFSMICTIFNTQF